MAVYVYNAPCQKIKGFNIAYPYILSFVIDADYSVAWYAILKP